MQPSVADVDGACWAAAARQEIENGLRRNGGVLFRGFDVDNVSAFEGFARAVCPELVGYSERTAPRLELAPNIFTSTEHPSDQYIHFHNANSYSHRWPMKIWFCCLTPAAVGGETPIADSRRVYAALDETLREEFSRRGVMYLRNFRDGVGLPWQETFQTDDPFVVRRYCAGAGIEIDLFEGDRLRTRQVRAAVAVHPRTGETVWFNQAHLFHVSSLESRVSRFLQNAYGEDDLPRNAYYGDGAPIPEAVVAEIIATFQRVQVCFPWERGDVLLLDNMLAAHSRAPFQGERLIAVTFGEVYSPPAA